MPTRNPARRPIQARPDRSRRVGLAAIEALEERAVPATFTVTSLGDAAAPDSTGTSLRAAIIMANNATSGANTITFAPSVTGTIDLGSALPAITNPVTIQGPGASSLEVSGQYVPTKMSTEDFLVNTGVTAEIDDLKISGSNNYGIENEGNLTVRRCLIEQNGVGIGTHVRESTTGSSITLESTTVANNLRGKGGAYPGDGLFAFNSPVTMTNCTIAGNSSAGIVLFGSPATLVDTTVTANGAFGPYQGSGASASGVSSANSANQPIVLTNSIVAGNEPHDGRADFYGTLDPSSSHDLVGSIASTDTVPVINNIIGPINHSGDPNFPPIDPKLGPLRDNGGPVPTIAPLPGSQAIDAGSAAGGPAVDSRGLPRTADIARIPNRPGSDGTDIGAVEVQSITPTATLTVNSLADTSPPNNVLTLREAISIVDGTLPLSSLSTQQRAQISGTLGDDVIQFSVTGTITLGSSLPTLNTPDLVEIQGPGAGSLTVGKTSFASNIVVLTIDPDSTAVVSGIQITHAGSNIPTDVVLNEGRLAVSNTAFVNAVSGQFGPLDNEANTILYDDLLPTLAVLGCTFSGDYSVSSGGAITVLNGVASISDSTFSNNTSLNGGAIFVGGGATATMAECTISGNTALTAGGGVYASAGSTLTLTGVTIAGNTAGTNGGGLLIDGSTTTMDRSIDAGNSTYQGGVGPDVHGPFAEASYDLIGNPTGITSTLGSTNKVGTASAPLDPKLGPLQANGGPTSTRELLAGSPALDAGPMTADAGTDQRGNPLVIDRDLGAYQATATTFVVSPSVPMLPGVATPVSFQSTDSFGKVDRGDNHVIYLYLGPTFTHSQLTGGLGTASLTSTIAGPTTVEVLEYQTADALNVFLPLQVETLTVGTFASTTTGFTANFDLPFSLAPLNLFDTAAANLGPADVTLVGAGTGPVRGSLIVAADGQSIRFVKTGGVLAPDTYTVTFRSAANAFQDAYANLLDGNADGTPGDGYTSTFTVAPSSARVVSIPDFARGPGQPVNVPATGSGLPLTISDGTGVTSISLTITYNPSLLTITGANLGSSAPAGSSVTINTSTPGTAILTYTSPTALPAGVDTFATLTASVPNAAPYASKEALVLSNIVVNGGSIPATDGDGVHVVAYLGDTTGNGGYSSFDATLIRRVIANVDTGFAAFPLLDPTILGDIAGHGSLSSLDATYITQYVANIPQPRIPALPGVTIVQGGPDPLVWLPRDLEATPGSTLSVPVMFRQTNGSAIGLDSADLAIEFDPSIFEVTGIRLGDVPVGFTLSESYDNATGEVIASERSTSGAITLASGTQGTLLWVDLTVRPGADLGAARINLLGEGRVGSTVLYTSLNGGGLTLTPAPSDSDLDPVDGLVTIVGAVAGESSPTPGGQALDTTRPASGAAPAPAGSPGLVDLAIESLLDEALAGLPAGWIGPLDDSSADPSGPTILIALTTPEASTVPDLFTVATRKKAR